MKKSSQNWLLSAQYDIETAKHMLQTGRYLYVVFMCHLSVEKMLKAIVSECQETIPPKTHNLYTLFKLISLQIPDQYKELFADLNSASLPVRYPEDLAKLTSQYNQKVAEEFFVKTQEALKWLKQHPKLEK